MIPKQDLAPTCMWADMGSIFIFGHGKFYASLGIYQRDSSDLIKTTPNGVDLSLKTKIHVRLQHKYKFFYTILIIIV